jgi:serine/threonine protein kinase/WD40 repeat protein
MENLSAVESIFLAALDRASPEDRAAYLDQACGKDAELRQRVERLLAAHPKVGGFLQAPSLGEAPTTDEPPVTERPGTVIGPYKLMEQIGEGGMGLVFVAEQQAPVRRKVALKIVKPGMDTRDVIARFEAERQALALMDHPNIARVLEAGATDSGRPYFVMELVRGVPITDFCDRDQLTPRERLALFISVCQAVQHAHSKGVIHRDIKPSNVLVTLHDGTPVAKVIDFGVAKAVGQSLTEKTIYTRFAQMIGTPLYMSPEQAEMGGLDVDTRCDVYALGVLLYELLTGTTPFDGKRLQKAAFDEIRRIIREEEPPKPSTRLTTLGESLSAVSARRKTDPKKLSALVKGDLDWIVMKALEKDRNRRYETASAFAADVKRFLGEEPVEARPPSAWYRFGKYARRHRMMLTMASLFAWMLLVGTAVSSWLAFSAVRAENEAMDAKKLSDKNAQLAIQREGEARAAEGYWRTAVYDAHMTQIPAAWEADDLAHFDQLLPWPYRPDLRGFEWYYWNRLRHGERRTVALAGGLPDCLGEALSPDGKRFAAFTRADGGGEFRLWDAATGALRRTLLMVPDNGLVWKSAPVPMVYSRHVRVVFSPDGRRVALGLAWLWKAVDPARPADEVPDSQPREVHVWDTDTGDELCRLLVKEGGGRFDGLAFSPGGKRLAFVVPPLQGVPPPGAQPPSRDRVLNMDTGAPCFPTAPADANVFVWDVDGRKPAWTLSAAAGVATPRQLAFSPDGDRLAVALSRENEAVPDDANQVQIWDTATRKDPRAFGHPDWLPNGVAFSPDGTRLAVAWHAPMAAALRYERLTLNDVGTGAEIMADELLKTEPGSAPPPPVFSPDGRRLTLPAAGSEVNVCDAGTGVVRYTVRGHAGTPAVAFSADGTRLLTAGLDGTVKEWAEPPPRPAPDGMEAAPLDVSDVLADRLLRQFEGVIVPAPDWGKMSRDFSPLASACTPDGLRLARATLGEGDKASLEVRIWDEKGGPFRVPIKADVRPSKVGGLLFNKDGTRLVAQYVVPAPQATDWRSGLKVWDVESGKELLTADGNDPFTGLLAVSPDGTRVAWNFAGGVRVLDTASGRVVLDVKEAIVNAASFNADGSRIAWGTATSVRVWDVAAARQILAIPDAGGPVGLLVFSPDGTRLAGAVGPVYVHGEVKIWDAATGSAEQTLIGYQSVQDLAFSPDGARLAAYGWRHDNIGARPGVTLWDAAAGAPLLQFDVADGGAGRRLRFQPDGGRLFLLNPQANRPADAYEVWYATPTVDEPPP